MKISIIDDYQDAVRHLDAFARLHRHDVTIHTEINAKPEILAEKLAQTEVLVPIRERTIIDEALLAKLPKLRLISQTGKGVAHIDVEACTRRGIPIAVSSSNSHAPAELTWTLVLAASRALPQQIASNKAARWQGPTIGTQLKGRVLGIYGYGSIGKIVAGYGKSFGMQVVVWGRETSLLRAKEDGYEGAASENAFFSQSDVVSLHLRLSAETKGTVTASKLALMKPTSILVNTSRADLIEPGALAAALRLGRPGMAAVDVYEQEPAYDHPLYALPNAICSPHLGYMEKDTYEVLFGGAFDNVLAFEKGNPENVINLKVFG